ncbi:MAG: ATP-binding protein [Eubacteriales bacterium]|nr:ATP-binding protein [Eubacteriales bacterium]
MERPTKETLTIEFKSDRKCYPMTKLYEDLVGMANTDGGWLFLGMEDDATPTGVDKQHMSCQFMEASIQDNTLPSLFVKTHIETWGNHDVLAIEVPISRQLMMTAEGKYLRRRLKRDGTPETVALKPFEILQRLSYIQAIDPSAQVIEDLPAGIALSPLERERLRNMIRTYHGDATLLDLSDIELDRALGFVRERSGEQFPTIAGLLMIGQEDYIRQYVPSHEVLFQVLDGVNVLANPPAMKGSLLQTFEKVELLFQSRIVEQELQIGLFRVPIPNYEKEAFREGFVNALVHRDYFRVGAVQVQLQKNALSISSPGGFLEGITPDNILTTAPTPRNVLLAEAAKRIGLAERTGRGIDKIYTVMLRSGHAIPDYSASTNTSVVLRLNSAALDEGYIKMIIAEEERLQSTMPVDALIALSVLKTERRATMTLLSAKIQKPISDTRAIVEWLIELGMVEGVGNGSGRRYMLSSKVYSITNNKAGYARQRGWDTMQERELLLMHLEKYNEINREGVVELCRCTANHASWLLRQLVKDGIVELCGSGRGSYYRKR